MLSDKCQYAVKESSYLLLLTYYTRVIGRTDKSAKYNKPTPQYVVEVFIMLCVFVLESPILGLVVFFVIFPFFLKNVKIARLISRSSVSNGQIVY